MNSPTAPCDGYWMNVNARQGAVPDAWKCLTQAEYDQRMAEYNRQDAQGGMFVLIAMGLIVSVVAIGIIVTVVGDLMRKKKKWGE